MQMEKKNLAKLMESANRIGDALRVLRQVKASVQSGVSKDIQILDSVTLIEKKLRDAGDGVIELLRKEVI